MFEVDLSVNGEGAADVGLVKAHEHDRVVVLVLDDGADGAPFESAPILALVLRAQENDNKVRIIEIDPL